MKTLLTGKNQRPNLHLPVLLPPLLVMLPINIETLVRQERTPQRARRGILRRVKVQVFLGDGFGVLSQAIEEVLER